MNPFQQPAPTKGALQQLRGRLQRVSPGSNPAVLNGSLTKPTVTRPLTDGDIVIRVAQRDLASGQFAHFDRDAFPPGVHTTLPPRFATSRTSLRNWPGSSPVNGVIHSGCDAVITCTTPT